MNMRVKSRAIHHWIPNTAVTVLLCAVLSACGAGGSSGVDSEQPQLDPTIKDAGTSSVLADASSQTEFTPDLGIQVNYEAGADTGSNRQSFIEAQWIHMQTCLQVTAAEPLVQVVEGKLSPEDASDDVIRHIDGQIQASAHVSDTGARIQIRSADFDGSVGTPGTYLRSILGRYLWLSASLPERDYPYDCAKG